ncbi:MAG: DsbA family protein [Rhodospirillales bacterium]|nr:DsbA family protein [Rhodospirillales bacterium]
MDDAITLFWSFRSPYSYIALPRVIGLSERFGVPLDLRVVHPAALRNPDYFRSMNPLARPYFMLDSARVAAFQGMAFRRPVPDPIAQDPATLAISPDQPLARRLGRLGVAATQRGRGVPFCREVSRLLWEGRVDGWDQGDHLHQAAARAGLDLGELDAVIAADPDGHEDRLARNDRALREAGHWGVPTMVYRGEPFFGQDRIEVLAWRLAGSPVRGEGNPAR